ncbi:hypothectical protein [Rubellimicrobium mesophilum DSM 19309]|uniref:Hypothectical protein n=1 Tax=Rubellimicrobium mesophilum DSM 19309 TaxID=442562 RepID=A0A017HTS0_9RHOB|nr:hypothetical protein [Rubellimicrobium mesophilum]EYD77134.1 hypothectical protein [Rubellimicrobium mesophilum DSM 19309]
MVGTGSAAVTAIFDSRVEAEAAAQRLIDAGIPAAQVKVMPENPNIQAEGRDVGTEGGFLGALFSVLFPRDDHDAYEEALRRGGILVVAEDVPAGLHEAALAALDQEDALDLDERVAAWKLEGWSGSGAAAMPGREMRRDPGRSRGRVRTYRAD